MGAWNFVQCTIDGDRAPAQRFLAGSYRM